MTFSCNEGYDIQGSSRVTCDANGLWSDFTPRCIPSKASLENDCTVNLFCYSLCHFDIGRPCSYIFGWGVLPLIIVKKDWIEKQNQTFIEHSWFCAYLKLVFSFHVFFQVVEWWFLNLIWWAAHLPLQTILEIMATTEAAPGFPGLGKVYITFWWLNTVNTAFSVRFFCHCRYRDYPFNCRIQHLHWVYRFFFGKSSDVQIWLSANWNWKVWF